MFETVSGLLTAYEELAKDSSLCLNALTHESLSTGVAEGHRTLGRVAWHVAETIPEEPPIV